MRVNGISSYKTTQKLNANTNKNNYSTNPYNSQFNLKKDEISFTSNISSHIDGKIQDYFTKETKELYDIAADIAKHFNSREIEMWHLYYASLVNIGNILQDIDNGNLDDEDVSKRNATYNAIIEMSGLREEEFKDKETRKTIMQIIDKHARQVEESFFPKEEKKEKSLRLGKKEIKFSIPTLPKLTTPKLSKEAEEELVRFYMTIGKDEDDDVFYDAYFLTTAMRYPDSRLAKEARSFAHDIKKATGIKHSSSTDGHLGFYDDYANTIEKNVNIGNDVIVTYDINNADAREYLTDSLIEKYKDSDTNVIVLNEHADLDLFTYLSQQHIKDQSKKTILVADLGLMASNASRDNGGAMNLDLDDVSALVNSSKGKKNSSPRIVLAMTLGTYINLSNQATFKSIFKTYNNINLPAMNTEEARKYLTDKDGLKHINKATGADIPAEVVERAIELTAQDKGYYPAKAIDLLSGLIRYNVDKKELTPKLLDEYVEENTALGKTKDSDEQELQIALNTKNKLNDIMGTPMTKAEAANIVNQIKKGTFKTKGYTIYQADGTAYGGGRHHTAQAIAGEAGIPMITINARDFALKEWDAQSNNSDFSEIKVKRIITAAKAQAEANPNKTAMIFIENFDNFGANSLYGLSSAYEQKAFNQLLLEMKKAREEDKVNLLVIGSVNNSELLDENILKPDKFLNTILVYQPMDAKSRREIIEYYIDKMNLAIKGRSKKEKGEIIQNISETTQGFSVVDLMYLLETAKSVSLERNKKSIDNYDLTEAYLQVTSGRVNTYESSEQSNRIIAAHEAGHAINLYIMNEIEKEANMPQFMPSSNVNFITLDPRGNFGGAMYHKPDKNQEYNIHTVMADLICSYGGHSVEKLMYGMNGSWGINCDIENITETATRAVLHLGMGPRTGTRKILFGPNGDLIASNKKKLEIEEDIDYLCHTAKEISEMIVDAYKPFIKQFSDKYYSKVGSGDCLITKEQFVKELNEWKDSLTDEQRAELEQVKHKCSQKVKRVEEEQTKLSKDC